MMEAVLSLNPPHAWVRDLAARYSLTVRVLECKYLDGVGVQQLFEINGPTEMLYRAVKELNRNGYVKDVEVLNLRNGRLLGSLKTRRCGACRILAQSECYLTSFSTQPDGTVQWGILGSGNAVVKLLNDLKEEGVEVSVKRISSFEGNNHLTSRQERLLEVALEKGYFDFPRRISLENLASLLNVAPSTLSEVLRRGLKKVVEEYFAESRKRVNAMLEPKAIS
jgi:predicted DNA binding protein